MPINPIMFTMVTNRIDEQEEVKKCVGGWNINSV